MNYKTIQSKIEEVENGHRAFLLTERTFDGELATANKKLSDLPPRLKKGVVLTISSGEHLPNAYRANRVNNTIVTLKHMAKNDWKIVSVDRLEVWKNSHIKTTMIIPKEYVEEIKEILLSKITRY